MSKKSDSNIVFVGASIISMLLALDFKKNKKTKSKIIIIEKSNELGGLYKSIHYQNDLVFDYGVHIYTETNIPEIDNLFIDILGEDQWEYMCGLRRDISGTYFNNKLQLNTPFVDLRDLPKEKKSQYIGDLCMQLKKDTSPLSYDNAKDFLTAKFGESLYKEIFKPIVYKHYKMDPSLLDPMATHIIPVGRVVLFDEQEVNGLMKADALRSRIAFPDQFSLPDCYLRPGRLIYPKKFGMFRVIEKLKNILEEYGVEFHTSSDVSNIVIKNNQCKSLEFISNETKTEIHNIEHMFWNAGYPLLLKYLGLNNSSFKPQFSKAAFVNIMLDKPANVGEMYYLYNFKPDTNIFRVVNYFNYCPGSISEKGFPICASTWINENTQDIESQVIQELKEMSIITDHKVNFIKAELNNHAFPNLTKDFIQELDRMRAAFRAQEYKNINVIGMLAEKGHFYLTEALEYAFKSSKNIGLAKTLFISPTNVKV
jgi:protoporphyrinogen oxidase